MCTFFLGLSYVFLRTQLTRATSHFPVNFIVRENFVQKSLVFIQIVTGGVKDIGDEYQIEIIRH